METRQATTGFSLVGRIERKTHSVERLRERFPEWDSLSKKEKHERVRSVEPDDSETVFNVTTDRFHEYFVDNLDRGQTAPKDNLTIAWIGLGDNGSAGTATSDTDLNNRTYEETITDVTDNGKSILGSTFLDSTEGNNNVFNEVGLFTGDPSLLANEDVFMTNHATFSDITKDNTKTVVFDVTLTFSDV